MAIVGRLLSILPCQFLYSHETHFVTAVVYVGVRVKPCVRQLYNGNRIPPSVVVRFKQRLVINREFESLLQSVARVNPSKIEFANPIVLTFATACGFQKKTLCCITRAFLLVHVGTQELTRICERDLKAEHFLAR